MKREPVHHQQIKRSKKNNPAKLGQAPVVCFLFCFGCFESSQQPMIQPSQSSHLSCLLVLDAILAAARLWSSWWCSSFFWPKSSVSNYHHQNMCIYIFFCRWQAKDACQAIDPSVLWTCRLLFLLLGGLRHDSSARETSESYALQMPRQKIRIDGDNHNWSPTHSDYAHIYIYMRLFIYIFQQTYFSLLCFAVLARPQRAASALAPQPMVGVLVPCCQRSRPTVMWINSD